jgi:thermitase
MRNVLMLLSACSIAAAMAGEANNTPRESGAVLYALNSSATSEAKTKLRGFLQKHRIKTTGKLLNGRVLRAKAGAGIEFEEQLAAELLATGAVDFAEPNYAVKATGSANDPGFPNQWYLPNIGATTAWDTTTGSSSIVVAILDSGCDPTHPDLTPNYVAGWNFYDNNSNTSDVQGHGTAVAGCVGAAGNNGNGIASVSWSSKLMPVRIAYNNAGEAYAFYSTIAQGMQWAVDHGAKIENCSYVGVCGSSTILSSAQYVHDHGGLFLVCAGNDNIDPGFAANANVIVVAGTDESNNKAGFSDFGSFITVTAPANNIYTTTNGSGYGWWYGTSFASPITAGVLALEWAANPGLKNDDLRSILIQTCDDLGATGYDTTFGYGKVNAANAVARAKSFAANTPPFAQESASPSSGTAPLAVSFSGAGSSDPDGSIAAYAWNFGDGTTGSGVNASHTYTTNGTFTATLTVTDNAGATASSSAIITVGSATTGQMRVSNIGMSASGNKKSGFAQATVTVLDQNGAAVSGAVVSGSWSGIVSGSASGTTSSSGTVSLSSPKTGAHGTITFTVSNVSKSGFTYNPAANTQTSGSITR